MVHLTTPQHLNQLNSDRQCNSINPDSIAPVKRSVPHLDPVDQCLAKSSLFRTLEQNTICNIRNAASIVRIKRGDILFRQGSEGDSLYIVVHGRLRVEVESKDGPETVGEIGKGESVGEMSLLSREVRSATVTAIRNTELIQISRQRYESLIVQHPELISVFAKLVTQRLQRTIQADSPNTSISTIAVLPLDSEIPLEPFVSSLQTAFGKIGSTQCLTSDAYKLRHVPQTYPADFRARLENELNYWLNCQEESSRFLLYIADSVWTPWTQHCIQQADRVLLIGRGDARPGPYPIEDQLSRYAYSNVIPHMELVLLHEDSPEGRRHHRAINAHPPRNTYSWLANRSVQQCHHVRLYHSADHARLARLVTGNAYGLVLGGGGARGFAHIGVIKALEEAGIPIDHIGGTSMGAIIAAQYAAGWDVSTMIETNQKFFQDSSLMDYTVPLVSLIGGKRFIKILHHMFGGMDIEDLWRPYFCLSSNLSQAKSMVHDRGSLEKWLSASIAIPGLGPPRRDGQDLLVDGGVLNNLPIDVMRQRCPGTVMASDVGELIDPKTYPGWTHRTSSWKLLWQKVNPFTSEPSYPSISNILWRSATLSSQRAATEARKEADLLLNPPLDSFSILDWDALEEICDRGYRYAQATIALWHPEPRSVCHF